MSQNFLEICRLVVSVISAICSLVALIVTYHNANRQVKESEKMRKEQQEQYEKEKRYNEETMRIKKRPYLVINKADCVCNGNNEHHMIISFKNKGNGSAFKVEPVTEITASNGNTINREEAIQDPIMMVNELCETKWRFDSPNRNFQFSLTIRFEDMSERLYQQTFALTLDSKINIMVTNYAEPKLVKQ